MIGEQIVGLAGTEAGARLAVLLALNSAFFHALFGALQKGKIDPWLSRGAIDAWLLVLSAPVALFVVPWPEAHLIPLLIGMVVIHFIYKITIAMAYDRAAYTVVYPVIRGTGPLLTVLAAGVFFHERFTALQWLGVMCLSGGILLLSLRNLKEAHLDRTALLHGLGWALAGGVMVAVYTIYDAWGIRQTPNPFTFLAWFFFLTAFDFPVIAALRYRRMTARPSIMQLNRLGLTGALVAAVSFGGVMLATRLDRVGEAAALRETSTVFAALIGFMFLGERVGPRKFVLMCLIALGAVLVEIGR